ncbi:transposase [Streptomyces inhibens]|uniref:transposase n=1 Tax=Streptomyces inhibens TaxID=2293571 RepID=UPI003144EE8B
MVRRHQLTDQAWAVIEPLLPRSRMGRPVRDRRQVVNGILWKLRPGRPVNDRTWRDGIREAVHHLAQTLAGDDVTQHLDGMFGVTVVAKPLADEHAAGPVAVPGVPSAGRGIGVDPAVLPLGVLGLDDVLADVPGGRDPGRMLVGYGRHSARGQRMAPGTQPAAPENRGARLGAADRAHGRAVHPVAELTHRPAPADLFARHPARAGRRLSLSYIPRAATTTATTNVPATKPVLANRRLSRRSAGDR